MSQTDRDSNTWIYTDTLNQHKCHFIPTPLAGSLPPASNSAFDISQPKAGHQQWSCHAVLSKQTLPPQTVSACKAPVIQPWNLPTSQTHSIISPLLCLSPPTLVFYHLSFIALFSSMFFSISLSPKSPFILLTFSLLPPLQLLLLSSNDPLPRPQGLTQLLWW